MSIFLSPQDCVLSADECVKLSYDLCGRNYTVWCKKENVGLAQRIYDIVLPIVERTNTANHSLQFDKIVFTAMFDALAIEIEKNDKKELENGAKNIEEEEEKISENPESPDEQGLSKKTVEDKSAEDNAIDDATSHSEYVCNSDDNTKNDICDDETIHHNDDKAYLSSREEVDEEHDNRRVYSDNGYTYEDTVKDVIEILSKIRDEL